MLAPFASILSMNVSSSQASPTRWRVALLALLSAAAFFGASFSLQAQTPATPAPVESMEHGGHAVSAPTAAADHAAGAHGAGDAPTVHAAGDHTEHAAHGLPQAAPIVGHVGPFPINSSMVLTWVVALVIIIFAQYATRQIKAVPDGAQNFWEWMVESLRNFLEGMIGRDLTRTTFWFFASVFIFIMLTNWFGLLPGVGTIGWGTPNIDGDLEHIETPLLRGTNADLNMTLAMSSIFFLCWIYWAIKSNGFGGFLLHIFGPKGKLEGWLKPVMIVVFFLVGLIEVVTIIFRPVSLSFRLYGNVFGGENIMETMATLVPFLAPIIPIPFYFLELLVGAVQALVFMLLTAVFTLLICTHSDPSHETDGHHH
jgi:F-type H+-transporting ATPase subunit a